MLRPRRVLSGLLALATLLPRGPIIVVWVIVSLPASAAGFGLAEQSAHSLGEAGTGTASAVGASALYYDPGNMAFEDGVSVEASGIVIVPNFAYAPDSSASKTHILPETFVQPAIFATAKVGNIISVGVGGFSNFGLGLQWPTGFPGRYDSTASSITTFTVNPSVAGKLNDNLGVGVGVDVVRATVELSQALQFDGAADGTSHLLAGTWGVGFNAGIGSQWLNDDLRIALNWRGLIPLHFTGRVDFSTAPEFASAFQDQGVTTDITLPNIFSLGFGYRIVKRLSVAFDLNYTTWSSLQSINLSFDKGGGESTLSRDWKNTLTARLGAEFAMTDWFVVRGGVGYDPSPSPSDTLSASLPDSNRVLLTAGLGYKMGSFSADLGYMYVSIAKRASSPPAFAGVYSGYANVAALTLSYRQ